MPLEHEMAEALTGHHFFLHADNPALGILRLDTKNDQRWLLMTRKSLLALSRLARNTPKNCKKHCSSGLDAVQGLMCLSSKASSRLVERIALTT